MEYFMKLTLWMGSAFLISALGANSGVADTPSTSSGTYTVPVKPALRPYATYDISDLAATSANGVFTLAYTIPEEFTGVDNQVVSFTGTDTPHALMTLTGTHGTASCLRAQGEMTCLMQMANLQIDPVAVATYLKANAKSPEELAGRTQVDALFSGEPIGVVTFTY
jgi:hypothetical protein